MCSSDLLRILLRCSHKRSRQLGQRCTTCNKSDGNKCLVYAPRLSDSNGIIEEETACNDKHRESQNNLAYAEHKLFVPPLAFDVLKAVEAKLPGFPIVLHGSSSVPQDEVATINKYGGALKAAIGIPEEWLRESAKSAVCKINIDSDSRLAMTAAIRQTFAEKPAEFDPRKYLGPARDNMEKMYKHKIINVLGSDGKLA